jgi:hypothetical protein
LTPSLCLVGLIFYLLIYMLGLIRDLDNPFEYINGERRGADVCLEVLERNENRLRGLLDSLEAVPVSALAHPEANFLSGTLSEPLAQSPEVATVPDGPLEPPV